MASFVKRDVQGGTNVAWPTVFIATAFFLLISMCEGITMEDVLVGDVPQRREDDVQAMLDEISGLRNTIQGLAKQVRTQQLFVEERIRSDGNSGIKQVRSYKHGTDSFHSTTHTGIGAAAIHNHGHFRDMLGMGEVVAVINGVEFRTRHNDYMLVRPSTTSKEWHATEPIEYPDVPPEVLNAGDVDAQIEEMIQWFKAFKRQDSSTRDYRQYFKPVLCYMEGAWTLTDEKVEEPFHSDYSRLKAKTWDELEEQIRYTAASGNKDPREGYAFLPTTIVGFNDTTLEPIYAQWNYRILCHPISRDVPTKYFIQEDDLTEQEKRRSSREKVANTRAARFRLSTTGLPKYTGFTEIDYIMQEIPGTDNIPDFLNEAPLHQNIYSREFSNNTLLNTGYYHRIFKTSSAGAMGVKTVNRAFADEFLFMAETTQEKVAPFDIEYCTSKRSCSTSATRFTYAIPLEIVYLTPLLKWNPHEFELWDNPRIPLSTVNTEGYYNGTSPTYFYYRTPRDFFQYNKADMDDPADNFKGSYSSPDSNGTVQSTVATGTRIILPSIKSVGQVRLRYPIYPTYDEGTTNWKELSVLKRRLEQQTAVTSSNDYLIKLRPSTKDGVTTHQHEFYLRQEDYDAIWEGQIVSVTTSFAERHFHVLDLYINKKRNRLDYFYCDNLWRCWDKHDKPLIVESGPGI